MTTVFIGDVGTVIRLDCGADVSTATVKQIKVRKSNGSLVTWEAELDTDPNYIKYTTMVNDIDVPGLWKLQAYIELPTWKGSGERAVMVINLKI